MSAKRQRFYVVFRGRNPGIYTSWDDAKEEVLGFKNNKHECFLTLQQAQEALAAYFARADANQSSHHNHGGQTQSSHHVGSESSSAYDFSTSSPVQKGCKMSYVT